MKSFDDLIEVARRLNDKEKGCPWDVKQTFSSLQKYILEEACELIDAVDDDDNISIIEELGDLLYVVIFYAKVAEREKRFSLEDILQVIHKKLIYRHPHVFGDATSLTPQEVEKQWDEMKRVEKSERTSVLDGVPRSLAALARAQKVLSKFVHHENEELQKMVSVQPVDNCLGEQMIQLVIQAEKQGLDAEKILRQVLVKYEEAFKRLEKKQL
jgi:uncharacterized protein YabN with tetrapyrrole methylase and pyrophosphatase domain